MCCKQLTRMARLEKQTEYQESLIKSEFIHRHSPAAQAHVNSARLRHGRSRALAKIHLASASLSKFADFVTLVRGEKNMQRKIELCCLHGD